MSIYFVALSMGIINHQKEKASPPCSAPSDSSLIRNIK